MRITIAMFLFFQIIACARQQLVYYPEYIPDSVAKNEIAQSYYGRREEPPIYGYKGIKAYRLALPFSGAIHRIEKYEDGSCLILAKGIAGYYDYTPKGDYVNAPIVELRVPIKRDCDKFIPFAELDAFFGKEKYEWDNGKDYKEGMHYDDSASMQRVTEDGTFYYKYTRDKEEVERLIALIRKIWGQFVSADVQKMF